MTVSTSDLVTPLRAVGREDLDRAGGKGANLGELIRMGMPVPDGFVITTEAFAAIPVALRDRASYEAAVIPASLAAAITAAYAELGSGPVAVRSSATAEDLPDAAFAGQQDTYLNVIGEPALLDAVRRCWGSLWTDRAVAYRDRLGIGSGDVRIAVVVQKMIEPDAAGVMFTADPLSGDRDRVVIEASAGLGEAVVSGTVTPDHYVLERDGEVREFRPGRREVVVRSAAGGGVAEATKHANQAGAEASVDRLPSAVLAELARLGVEVERHFGRPQDIEWAYASGRVQILQARPMTALPPPPLGRLNPLRRRLAAVLLEYLPTRPYPMDMSTWLPHGPAGLMAKVTESVGLHGAFEGFLREVDGVVYQLVPPTPRPTPRLLIAPVLLAARARRHDPAQWADDPRYSDYRARVRALSARDVASMPWRELIRMPREALALVEPVADLRIDYLPGAGVAIARLFLALKILGRASFFGDLLLDGRSRTEQANRDLEQLAARVRDDADLASRIATSKPADLVPVLERMPEFRAFLEEHGHRESASPLLVTSPTWGEAPEIVAGLVSVLISAPAASRAPGKRPRVALLHPRLQRWVERARAGVAFREDTHYEFTRPLPALRGALLEVGRRLVAEGVLDHRDDVWHLRLEEIEALPDGPGPQPLADRPGPQSLPDRAVPQSLPDTAGPLSLPDRAGPQSLPDVPGRQPAQRTAVIAASDRERLRAIVAARAARREELASVRMIDLRAVFPVREVGDALVFGEPASGGRATGRVRVIRHPGEFGRLEPGDVLVCPYTNPSWTPLFQRAAAVVVDAGGVASHAAIVAREYGIPVIMGTADGTAVLDDGRLVTVDGDRGLVTAAGVESQ